MEKSIPEKVYRNEYPKKEGKVTGMIRVGAVNIDTSHPMGFAEAMGKTGRMKYVGVYDDSFSNEAEINGFVARFGLEKRCADVEELADMCDVGFLHGCNWDDHVRFIQPFASRGKPVFVDKPLAGSVADCRRIRELVKSGAVILGASSARYAGEIQKLLSMEPEERGEVVQVYGTSGVDEFHYGIHIVEAIGGILGQGADYVKYIGRGEQDGQYGESFYVHFKDGRSAVYTTLTGVWQRFAMQLLTTRTTYQFIIDPVSTYGALLEQIANYMEGASHRLVSADALLESVEIMLAGAASRRAGGTPVRLDSLDEKISFDGTEFWKGYQASRKPIYAVNP